MRRTTWMAVAATVTLIAAAGSARLVHWKALVPAASKLALDLGQALRTSLGTIDWSTVERALVSFANLAITTTTGPALAVLCAGLALIAWGLSGDRAIRRRVVGLAGRGTSVVRIATRTRLPQDAVRTLLHPAFDTSRRGA